MGRTWLGGNGGDGGDDATAGTAPLRALQAGAHRRPDPAGVLIDGDQLAPLAAVPAARNEELQEAVSAWFRPQTPVADPGRPAVPSSDELGRAARSLVLLGEHEVAAWMRRWAIAVAGGGYPRLPAVDPSLVRRNG